MVCSVRWIGTASSFITVWMCCGSASNRANAR
jgi:hypothetical protein